MRKLKLYSEKLDEVQSQAGLNWGFSDGHVCTNDAYIALPTSLFYDDATFFPEQGSVISATWDDGTEMNISLEGTQSINDVTHPKQLSTDGDKSILGEYIRERLGVPNDKVITREDLQNYGREDVDVSYDDDEDTYFFDFSV